MRAQDPAASRRALFAWCLFDWANSAYSTVIVTFVFARYFAHAVAADGIAGTAAWGYALSLSGLAVALAGPFAGAVADHGGRRKPWILGFGLPCVVAIALLFFVRPDPAWVLYALVLVGLANFTFEMAFMFYNAMLPELAPPGMVGRVSGWGWALGYAGGLVCLGIALLFVERGEPWLGLDAAAAEPVRATALLVAAWFALFAAPLFLWTPDRPASGLSFAEAARRGFATLVGTLGRAREQAGAFWFLLAHMVYTDGLNTLFAFGGIYAAGSFGMDFGELIVFGIALNVSAGLGAFFFSWLDDWIGPKRTILLALAGLIGFGSMLVAVEGKALFWAFGLPLGLFVGPAQSAGRSLMAGLAPAPIRTEMFGLFALSGKAMAFVGPAVFAFVTAATGSQRLGMATVLVSFLLGAGLMLKVPDARG